MSTWILLIVGVVLRMTSGQSCPTERTDHICKCYHTHHECGERQHCFLTTTKREKGLLSWNDSITYCNNLTYSLVAVTDDDVRYALEMFMDDFDIWEADIWLNGQQQPVGQWQWISRGTPYNETDLPVPPGQHVSAVILSNGSLQAENSKSTNGYICQFEGVNGNQCGNDAIWSSDARRCYMLHPRNSNGGRTWKWTWYEARNSCLRAGGDLMTNYDDLTKILNSSNVIKDQNYWIGLQWNPLIWNISGRPQLMTLTNFRQDTLLSTTGGCLAMERDSSWRWSTTRNCSDREQFICYIDNTKWSVGLTPRTTERTTQPIQGDMTLPQPRPPLKPGEIAGLVVGCVLFYILSLVIVAIITIQCSRQHPHGRSQNERPMTFNSSVRDNPSGDTPDNDYGTGVDDTAQSNSYDNKIYDDNKYGGTQGDKIYDDNRYGGPGGAPPPNRSDSTDSYLTPEQY